MVTVSGPGIDIGLDDAPVRYESVAGLLVHDIYLNEIVNTLREAGAQAIAFTAGNLPEPAGQLPLAMQYIAAPPAGQKIAPQPK